MTQYYYIASSRELPTGSFGKNKTVMTIRDYIEKVNPSAKDQIVMQALLEKDPEGDQLMDIYETELDAAGLYVAGPMKSVDASCPFQHPYIYQVDPDGGSFEMNDEKKLSSPEYYQCSRKCITELFEYMGRHLEIGEELELYSCTAYGCERFSDLPNKDDLMIDLSTFQLGDNFEWKERQMIRVRK
ncbi:hypothetical protein [Paenibacillus sp. VMFN-D1]|uniref:hypothetical protein n=1 Tax=Paenibacillus sp. VMFN-D1 TaxID=2135608 RepID=UPI000E227A3A|nr:hypothetical protein [Paenibacillus sp. VMFN-D1]RED40640.1 hypothetical protein C7820_1804 [Paenibacillus sp. VMFN-D1]